MGLAGFLPEMRNPIRMNLLLCANIRWPKM